MSQKRTGFTIVPVGNQLKKQAKILSIKADGFRYQNAFEDYYEEYHHFPDWCPLGKWFDLSLYSQQFIETFHKMEQNAYFEGARLCEFTAEELQTKNISSIQFFLPIPENISYEVNLGIEKAPANVKIYGTKILFFIPDE